MLLSMRDQENRKRGREEARKEISLRGLRKGYSYEWISGVTGVPVETLRQWEKEEEEQKRGID
ncbi:MAG: hypothetical protein Q4C82_10535 [Eubacteriales bacterium]|nr:hypothetical protein [Eubacteriales bacterium]